MTRQLDALSMVDDTWGALREAALDRGFPALAERLRGLGAERVLWLRERGGRWHVARDRRWDGGPRLEREVKDGLLKDLAGTVEARCLNFEVLRGYPTVVTLPLVHGGTVVALGGDLSREVLPRALLLANLMLCGRTVEDEMRCVAEIQRSLLPAEMPEIESLELAAYYRPVTRAGGDYYDFFPLARGRWGIVVADASGHGCGAAVEMAITRTLAHTRAEKARTPGALLRYVNEHLAQRQNVYHRTFVTAFYGIYDPRRMTLRFACAGHPAPRVKRCATGELFELRAPGGTALGILEDERYPEAIVSLRPGDQMVLYTDGITEAFGKDREMFGTQRLDWTLGNCHVDAEGLVSSVVKELERFTGGGEPADDRTLLAARVIA